MSVCKYHTPACMLLTRGVPGAAQARLTLHQPEGQPSPCAEDGGLRSLVAV